MQPISSLNGSATLEEKEVPTDHSFSDRRIALQTIVVEWLDNLQKRLSEMTNR